MNCKEFARYCQSYIDGELDEKLRQEAQSHFDNCPRCEKLVIIEKRFKALLVRKITVTRAPKELHIKIQTKLF